MNTDYDKYGLGEGVYRNNYPGPLYTLAPKGVIQFGGPPPNPTTRNYYLNNYISIQQYDSIKYSNVNQFIIMSIAISQFEVQRTIIQYKKQFATNIIIIQIVFQLLNVSQSISNIRLGLTGTSSK